MTATEQDTQTRPHLHGGDLAFFQKHLDRVSRSFAVCIAQLEAPLRQWTSLAYLLCRALDTIEDSLWPKISEQTAASDAFEQFVQAPPQPQDLTALVQSIPTTAKPAELLLLDDAARLFEALHQLPARVQAPMQAVVLRMCAGMRHYSAQAASTGVLRLIDVRDVNRYCYFVAGLVGHLLTELFKLAYPGVWAAPTNIWRHAFDFGLFLQKVNLLKDQRADEAEGRFLVPDRARLRQSLRSHIEGSVAYLAALPQDARSFRTFCGWSLFLGAASLPAIEAGQMGDSAPKMPRAETEALMHTVATIVQDDAALRAGLNEYVQMLPQLEPDASKRGRKTVVNALSELADDWFAQAHGGLLTEADLKTLGL